MVSVEVDQYIVARLLDGSYLEGRTKGGVTHVSKSDIAAAVAKLLSDYGNV